MKSTYQQQMLAPADAALFLEMSQVFQTAARVPLPAPKGPGYHLTDIPMNRGMLAVTCAMRKLGKPQAAMLPLMSRLMNLGDIFEQREVFGHFIRPSSDDDGIEVADALLKGAAVARMVCDEDGVRFDLDDVLVHARRFEAAGDVEEGTATA